MWRGFAECDPDQVAQAVKMLAKWLGQMAALARALWA